jgi:putative tricarboxylic transport membrane protein
MKKFSFPLAPVVLGFILGPIIEVNLLRGLMRSHESFIPFLTAPIAAVFLVITFIVIVMTVIGEIKKDKEKKEEFKGSVDV